MKEIFKSWVMMDVEIIMENCPITIPHVHALTSSNQRVQIKDVKEKSERI